MPTSVIATRNEQISFNNDQVKNASVLQVLGSSVTKWWFVCLLSHYLGILKTEINGWKLIYYKLLNYTIWALWH